MRLPCVSGIISCSHRAGDKEIGDSEASIMLHEAVDIVRVCGWCGKPRKVADITVVVSPRMNHLELNMLNRRKEICGRVDRELNV